MTIRKIENARQEECDYIYNILYINIYLYIVYYIYKFIQQSQNS